MKTLQEIFDQVATHLIKQGKQATGADGGCAYLAKDGSMCAVGCLLTNYDPAIEGCIMTAQSKRLLSLLTESGIDVQDPQTRSLLQDLQVAHDKGFGGNFTEVMSERLKHIAAGSKLSTEALDKAVKAKKATQQETQ